MPHRLTVLLILLVIVLASTPIRADMPGELDIPSGTYKNDPAHTSLTWRIGHMGLSNFTGRMNDVVIRLELDADDLTKSVVEATIDPASVDTGYPHTDKSFDDEVGKDARFLNATVFPSVTFVSNEISLDDDGQVLVVGDLTLLGISRSVTLSGILNGIL